MFEHGALIVPPPAGLAALGHFPKVALLVNSINMRAIVHGRTWVEERRAIDEVVWPMWPFRTLSVVTSEFAP